MSTRIPTVVLGGTGYVAGELLRLIAAHPDFALAAVMSDSQPGASIAGAFPHLRIRLSAGALQVPGTRSRRSSPRTPESAVFFRSSARRLRRAHRHAPERRAARRDATARGRHLGGFPLRNAAGLHAGLCARARRARADASEFTCALPEQLAQAATPHIAHPGCFATAILLAAVPLLAAGIVTQPLFVSGVTGSTGSGRKPVEGTHHPLRHADLYSYSPLAHRHVPEVTACAFAATGVEAQFAFVPHSGPFARGIHVTVQAAASRALDTTDVLAALRAFYAHAPFVRVSEDAPRLKDVVASNYAHLSAVAQAGTVAVMCAIDNLTKGAAGGAVQWMNRLFALPETTGLTAPAPGWT